MFPEITSRLKGMLDCFGSRPVSPDLKAAGGFSFDAVNVGWCARNGYPGLYSILSGGMPAWSGEVVSLETALNHSVVWACTRIISESTGFIPLVMLQQKNGVKNPAIDHPMFSATDDEWLEMTPRQLHALRLRQIEQLQHSELMTGIIASVTANFSMTKPEPPFSAESFMIHKLPEFPEGEHEPEEETDGDKLLRILGGLPAGAAIRLDGQEL